MMHSVLDLQVIYKQTVVVFLSETNHVAPVDDYQDLIETRSLCFEYVQKLLQVCSKKCEYIKVQNT